MPAREETWRDTKKLHRWFAISSVALLLSTLWMMASDHDRSWKKYQKTARHIDIQMTQWRRYQYETNQWQRKKEELEKQLFAARTRIIPAEALRRFQEAVHREAKRLGRAKLPDLSQLDSWQKESEKLLQEKISPLRENVDKLRLDVEQLRLELDDAKARQGQPAGSSQRQMVTGEVAELERKLQDKQRQLSEQEKELAGIERQLVLQRDKILGELQQWVRRAQFDEELVLQRRKFKAADVDAQRAKLDIAIRDARPEDVVQAEQRQLDGLVAELDSLTLQYQAAASYRKQLQEIIKSVTAEADELEKQLARHEGERHQIDEALRQKRTTFFVSYILPGKKWLELPILDAFNSPLKIDNLWSEGLEQNYNHRYVRRFDRCTTCHKSIDKTLAGSASAGAYPHETMVEFEFIWPESSEPSAASGGDGVRLHAEAGDGAVLESVLGIRLANAGLVRWSDVTVAYVRPQSPAAEARPVSALAELLPANEVRQRALKPVPFTDVVLPPGLIVGDVIERINGDRVASAERATFALLQAYQDRRPLKVTVRRGLPHPYASHPRLDLFVGSSSPHPMATFACTVCHEGQGSATEFKWVSHTPNSPDQRRRWVAEHDWFDNHHWVYPMFPKRFAESSCLKCHHDVIELESSERFPDPPAPKLMHGYQLIRKYGCFGCHEIPGSDGTRRVGPDLRLEPNYFAAALQLKADPSYQHMTEQERQWVETVIYDPDDSYARRRLYQALVDDGQAETPRFTQAAREVIAPLLKDVESPGQLRKVGPSLRFVAAKLDGAFLYDWIRQPQRFRPDTRMPQFFGLWNHLADAHSLQLAQRLEPVEILGMVEYLRARSQPFTPIEHPQGITPSTTEEKIARGKQAFQMRGCLACHTHRDFPEAIQYRAADSIAHAPDLSNMGDKLDPQRNPQGKAWLYSWLKQPHRYHPRSLMPEMYLDPVAVKDASGQVVAMYDPAEDITEYLMASRSGWQPAPDTPTAMTDALRQALDELMLEHLKGVFYTAAARDYIQRGIPDDRAAELKGAERELLVPATDYQARRPLGDQQKLLYIGRKSIAKYGCFGCHDIPGFEDAKPIGTPLSDWGRKDPARLAFEHIAHYMERGHRADAPAENGGTHGQSANDPQHAISYEDRQSEEYYREQLLAGNRIGFIYQKLKEPRSYDYDKTLNKSYNDRLRMPQFSFDLHQREAIITFVLGLVAEPPSAKYVYKPSPRTKAILDGKRVLEKYNCAGCHILQGERWELSFKPGTFGTAPDVQGFDFTLYKASSAELQQSQKISDSGMCQAVIEGLPLLDNDGLPMATDVEGEPLFPEEKYNPRHVSFSVMLLKPAVLDGQVFQVQQGALPVRVADVAKRRPAEGGDVTRYLLPHVVAFERQANPNLKASESWGWLPPPLVGEGSKVQPDWLHNFLLKPYPIRPAVVMRMPRFNMSSHEASQLVDYFAARDDAEFPYSFVAARQSEQLHQKDQLYRQRLQQAGQQEPRSRFADALRVVTNNQYCVQCHIVGDFIPTKEERGKGPDLAVVYRRLRADYLRRWVARPAGILPYTGMPVVFTDNPDQPGGTNVPQTLYHGTSLEQLDAVVDLLINYDQFASQQVQVSPLVRAQQPPASQSANPPPPNDGQSR